MVLLEKRVCLRIIIQLDSNENNANNTADSESQINVGNITYNFRIQLKATRIVKSTLMISTRIKLLQ
jgi:hypothetical protein